MAQPIELLPAERAELSRLSEVALRSFADINTEDFDSIYERIAKLHPVEALIVLFYLDSLAPNKTPGLVGELIRRFCRGA